MNNNYLCFTNFSKINELLCLFATIHVTEKMNTSYYNLIIKKCRQLIFENSEVLASPHHDQIYGIFIIVKESYYETGELQKYLINHNLKAGAPTIVLKYIYEDCCMYTIIAKLAPKWNLVSNYFIRGREFLTNTGQKDCVKLSLCINDIGETSMIFEISRIRLPSMSLNKLDLTDNYLQKLNETNMITFKQHNSKTIRVLPSLKRGNILSINLNINKSSSFQTYQQFRRHWKNTYGYRLPEIDKDIFYLEISFFDGSPLFTYPSVCVRPYEPTFVQRVEARPVVAGFIADLMRSMPEILGDKYPVPSHINQPKPRLFSATETQQFSNIGTIDIKFNPDSQSSAIVYLPTQKRNNIENNEQDSRSNLSQLVSQLKKPENKSPIYVTQKTTLSQGISLTPHSTTAEKRLDENDITNINRRPLSDLNKPSLISQEIQNQTKFLTDKVEQRTNMTPKKIPNFSKSVKSTTDINQATNDTKPTEKIVPAFISKFPKIKKIKNIPDSVTKPLQKPVQKELKSQEVADDDLADFKTTDMKINKKPITPIFKMDPNSKSSKTKRKNENLLKHINNTTDAIKQINFENNLEAKKPNEKLVANHETLIKNNNNNNTERKRVNLENSLEAMVAKKPREKTAPTEINNMKELVNNGTVNKLNVQSLMKWLKDRNIHCTTKDKKSVLVEKVINNLSKQ